MDKCTVLLPNFSFSLKLLYLFINIVTSFLATLGNVLVILTFMINKKLRKPSNVFLLMLSVTDITIGVFVQPLLSVLIIDVGNSGQHCEVISVMCVVSIYMCGTGFNILAIIAYDRYLHLSKLNNYNQFMTTKKLRILIAVSWIHPIIVASLIFDKSTFTINNHLTIIGAFFLTSVIFLFYYKTWKIVKNKTINTKSKKINKQWKVTKSMVIILLCCFFAWSPLSIFLVFQVVNDHLHHKNFQVNNLEILYFCYLCGFSNSSINPFLYYWRNENIKKAMRKVILEKIFCNKVVLEAKETSSEIIMAASSESTPLNMKSSTTVS